MIDWLAWLLSDTLLVVAVIGLGLVLTIRSRALQLRHFRRMFHVFASSFRHDAGRLSSFQALMMSLAGRVGTGNIAGVAVAIAAGGPGAVFWMWVVGLLGMATSFFECSLAQLYKVEAGDGTYRGGPAYYIERGLGIRRLGLVFSVLLFLHAGLFMNAFQAFTVASSLEEAFGFTTRGSGIVMTAVLAVIVFGGIRRIASAADLLVPVMVLGYLGCALWVVITHLEQLPGVVTAVVGGAFGLDPLLGGSMGAAIVHGAKRGLFSNEAGLGTAPNVAAIAQVRHPAAQGLLQALSVFIDTMVVCTSTAAIVLFSGIDADTTGVSGVLLTQVALAELVGPWGRPFVSLAVVLFAFTSVMYSYYLAENCLAHLGARGGRVVLAFRCVVLVVVYWGTRQDLATIFTMADLMMACLASVNVFALFAMSGTGLRLLADYERQRAEGIADPLFDSTRFADPGADQRVWGPR